ALLTRGIDQCTNATVPRTMARSVTITATTIRVSTMKSAAPVITASAESRGDAHFQLRTARRPVATLSAATNDAARCAARSDAAAPAAAPAIDAFAATRALIARRSSATCAA